MNVTMSDDQFAGAVVRQARERAGMTLSELSAKVGMPYSAVSLLERGGRKWTIPHIKTISRALGLDPMTLLGEGESSTAAA